MKINKLFQGALIVLALASCNDKMNYNEYNIYGKDYINDYRNWIDFITLESIRDTLDKLVVSENIFEVSMQKEK